MKMHTHETSSSEYQVKVGHVTLIVRAISQEDAIALARRKLALEMPRFYDIIRSLGPERFAVRQAA